MEEAKVFYVCPDEARALYMLLVPLIEKEMNFTGITLMISDGNGFSVKIDGVHEG